MGRRLDEKERLIELDRLLFSYEGSTPVLEEASLSLFAGERIGMVGPIGSGKTTLLHMIVGLLRPQGGRVRVFGSERKKEHDFWEVRERVGLLFQDPEDQLFCPTVLEDIAFGPLNLGKTREEAMMIVTETLRSLGLEGYADRITHHLSGGEKRLVSIASVLAMDPEILLLDEPTSGLDSKSYQRVSSILHSLPQAMIVVSHDEKFLQAVTDRLVRIENGRVIDLPKR